MSAVWDLTKTASGALELGKEAMIAATRDNVQPLTLFACESFGATLAICPETRLKVQHALAEVADPVYLKFLKAQIGFERGSSVDILSRSMDGVRFLALATALVSSMDLFHASNVLETMIEASAADKTLLPTSFHLKLLLQIIEPRVNRVGFTNDVFGWMTFLRHHPDLTVDESETALNIHYACPWLEGLKLIVEAFRSLARLGSADEIVIHSEKSVPWLISFTKWCLGIPPKLQSPQGLMLLDQTGSRVTIQMCANRLPQTGMEGIRVEISSTAQSLLEVFEVRKNGYNNGTEIPFRGMVSPSTHCDHILAQLGTVDSETELGRLTLLEALPNALRLVRNKLFYLPDLGSMPHDGMVASQIRARLGPWSASVPCPFPSEEKILATMAGYVSAESPAKSDLTQSRFTSWHELSEHLSHMDPDEVDDFMYTLAHIVANIYALSLIDGPLNSVLVHHPSFGLEGIFGKAVYDAMSGSGTVANVDIECILIHTLSLLGHKVTFQEQDWVLSSFHGQVVFPKLFQTEILPKTGYLELYCVPGNLLSRERGRQYQNVVSGKGTTRLDLGCGGPLEIPVTCSLNRYQEEDLQWVTTFEEDLVTARLKSAAKDIFGCIISPFSVLRGVAKSVFLHTCSHPANRTLDEPLLDCFYYSPFGIPASREHEERIQVIPVKGHRRLRMLAIAVGSFEPEFSVVINHACLGCAVEIGRALGSRRIVC